MRAIRDARQVIEQSSGSSFGGNLDITGIEIFILPSTARNVLRLRKQSQLAVLDEQERQERSGEYDPDKLAMVSHHHTQWAAELAREFASYD